MKLLCATFTALVLSFVPPRVLADTDRQAPAEVTPSEAHSWLLLFETIVDTVVANRDNCDRMAGALRAVIDANQDTIAMAREAKAKGKRLPAAVQKRMLDGVRRMVAALDRCGRDAKVVAEFKRIDLGSPRRN